MRLAIYVPKAQAERWTDEEGSMSFSEFQLRLYRITGSITLTSGSSLYTGSRILPPQPVLILESLMRIPDNETYRAAWSLLRTYAAQLLRQGEKAVLIVQDNEPTYIT